MSRGDYPSAKQDQFVVRLPDGMRGRIKAAAEANNRSMNAEIVATLEEAYPEPKFSQEELLQAAQVLLGFIASGGDAEDVPDSVREAASIISGRATLVFGDPPPEKDGLLEFGLHSLEKGNPKD